MSGRYGGDIKGKRRKDRPFFAPGMDSAMVRRLEAQRRDAFRLQASAALILSLLTLLAWI